MDDRQRRSRTASDRSGSKEHPDRQRTHRSETARGQDIRGQGSRQQGARSQSGRSQASRNPNRRPANRRPAARRPQTKRRRRRNLGIRICLTVILIIAAIAAVFLWKRYSPSKEKANLDKYYGIEQEGQLAIVVNNEVVEPKGMIADGKAYIQYEIVRDYINSRFYWDPNENILLYTLPKDMVSVEVGSKDYTVSKDKNSEDYVILKTEGSTAYIALDFVQQYTNIDYEVYDNPERVVIVGDWGEHTVAEVKKDTQVRYQGGVKSPILTEIKKGEEVTVIENEENWKKVRTKNGFIGYIKNSALKDAEKKNVTRKFEEQEFTNISKDYTINMAWHNVTNSDANSGVLQKIAESKGLTTIAPTWFHVKDTDGNMDSIASTDYVNYAHQANIEVWATIRDFDGGINSYDESYALLSYTSKRETLINQLVAEALQSNIDGINVDFEKISEECGEHYIQFIRELSVRCRQNGLVLSVDNYVPKGFNMQYDRKEQGIVADYVVIMGYDEHYAGSPEAGSVASYDFVKEGITETLKEVPADKVISGIPFFTRLWEQTPKTEEELASQKGTEEGEYAMKVESKAYGMTEAKEVVSQAGAEITWDDTAKQNYARWESGGVTYEIWLEDEKSLEMKLELMKQNKLAGTAAWALGLEDPNVWQLILKYVN
ncbi:glycosyl hydrolase family 18 protein [Extibacter sp. GGCC_0201]|uniref:glycosyl hydrolase family 18 protein n=1 Tax=Extibacter sp. GGCC_0201 TaxID=2731209 RepID=UPI001FB6F7DE|nr:glycosyl hydrolase family 18 protein [Extibacter sp. GGCC_0201]MBO1719798.1 SH3 domain-containing protein [Extibacter sp. GGCC_0201]